MAHELLGHRQPSFAPVAAVITLGLTVGERRELGRCATELHRQLEDEHPEPARAAAIGAAGLANRVLEETGNLSAVHIVGQIRLAAVDLLRASGLGRDEAQAAVRTAVAPTDPPLGLHPFRTGPRSTAS